MSVPSTRGPQKIPVSQIHPRAKCCVILVFMQGNYPLKQDIEAAYEDFPIVGIQMSGWQA
jgi:hypothetical protein